MHSWLIPLIVGFGVLAIQGSDAEASSRFRDLGSLSSQEHAYIISETDVLKRRLRDPDSARFRDLHVSRRSGSPVVCGQVNARNAFGGYSGFERFVSASAGGIIVLESDMAAGEMSGLWRRVCD